ncbi:hypothetical protein KIH86_20470 [Paenibacillus sp. HN-1]|uniref:hypothetical protein n=1 Tax=Paenibacillus TaxID=44249 RepID=UPI001CA92ACD|nr:MULTISPECIES: hypothetical protein [Paenibacillus]MBY9077045.1 hypothetical protein [Paenibacillus sp. CGMCC 1.18879]MBY9086582.1 hypothetical protein [Paenibacillus sinensis]
MESKVARNKRGSALLRLLVGLVVVVLLAGAGLVWYAAPQKKLDLAYTPVDFGPKLLQMAKNHSPVLTLSEEELNQLCKKGLNDYIAEHPSTFVRITGSEFAQNGNRLTADITGKAGPLPFGATIGMLMEVTPGGGGVLTLHHEYTEIRGRELPSGLLSLPDISVPLREHMPFMVEVKSMKLLDSGISVSFDVDWSNLLNLLLKLK